MQFTCELCGSTSNSGLASFQEKLWREGHTCVRRKRSVDAELAERIAAARSFKRIPLPEPSTPAETVEWHDSSFDRWGAPTQRQVVAKSWGGGNCLKACIASILGAEISRVPEPADDWSTEAQGWLSRYSERLAKQTGYRLDKLPPTVCPPRNPNQLWIATVREDGDADHCVVSRDYFVVRDPTGIYQGSLPMDRLVDGLLVVPTRRVVPVFSLHGRGYVAA